MSPKSVDASHGLAWLVQGWRLFSRDPGTWIVLGIIIFVTVIVLTFIPLVGYLVGTLITPALIAGMVYGASQVKAGRTLAVDHLFRGFKDRKKTGPLLTLGAVMLGAAILSLLVIAVLLGASMLAMMGADAPRDMVELFGVSGLLALVLVIGIHIMLAMALMYAIPLVMLRNIAPSVAIRSSLAACLRNIIPLLVFAGAYVLLAVIATLPILLGWLVLLPWTAGTLFSSYNDLYG
jgi:hypothetical protein